MPIPSRVISSTTSMGEKARSTDVAKQQESQSHTQMDVKFCKIQKFDGTRKTVSVTDEKNNKLFGGRGITLGHSVHDIVDRFGTIRKGMEVCVIYKGNVVNPSTAIAFIIGEEDESGPNKDLVANNMAQGFHNILMENL